MKRYDCLALFSGGLDSILACKVVADQGLSVLALHFVTPFFGKPRKTEQWNRTLGLDVQVVDVSEPYVRMILDGPAHGFGKHLNPCIDCKIFMLRLAREMMPGHGARFLVSGEVVGQRPMSQRRDALNIISRDAGVRDVLLRPLCAKHVDPTAVEKSGLVDRERLLDIAGRGRKRQLELARHYGVSEIPTPAGGCPLADAESSARFFQVMSRLPQPGPADFELAQVGRQYWAGGLWLSIGRNESDNRRLEALATERDVLLKVRGYPGPLALLRIASGDLHPEDLGQAAAFMASFSSKAVQAAAPVDVTLRMAGRSGQLSVMPGKSTGLCFCEPDPAALAAWKGTQHKGG